MDQQLALRGPPDDRNRSRHVPAHPALAEGADTARQQMEEALTAGDLAPKVNGWARTYQLRNTGRRNDQMGIGFTGALFFALRLTW